MKELEPAMRRNVASRARRRTHRREGQEQQGPPTGVRWGTDREAGSWWGLYFEMKRSRPNSRSSGSPVLATTTQGPKSGMIARRADYTPGPPGTSQGARPMSISCPACQTETSKKFGRTREGHQRHRCLTCRTTFWERPERPLGEMRLAPGPRAPLPEPAVRGKRRAGYRVDHGHGEENHPALARPGRRGVRAGAGANHQRTFRSRT